VFRILIWLSICVLSANCSTPSPVRRIPDASGSESAMSVPADSFTESLNPLVGRTITLAGILCRGNSAFALCPTKIKDTSAYCVFLYASRDNIAGNDVMQSLHDLSKSRRFPSIQVTGVLHRIDAAKSERDYNESEAFFCHCYGKDKRVFWLEVKTAARIY